MSSPIDQARRYWMSVLALAPTEELEAAWRALPVAPAYRTLRGPDVGLAMVRGRAGGTGMRFNVGEMTITRCSVALDDRVGHAWVGGRRRRHAELAAVFDALLQNPVHGERLEREVVTPLAARQREARRAVVAQAAATRVDFFTVVRGE